MKSESEVAQSCLTLHDPMVYSLTDASILGIFQARGLEWGAIAFSHFPLSLRKNEHFLLLLDKFSIHRMILLNNFLYLSVLYLALYVKNGQGITTKMRHV